LKILGIERLYPNAKSSLASIYTIVGHELKDQNLLSLKSKYIKQLKVWEITINAKWPEVMSFSEIGKTKGVASKNAALKCLQWLEMNDKLKNGKPIIYNKENLKDTQVKSIELTPEILNNMTDLIETYNKVIFIYYDY